MEYLNIYIYARQYIYTYIHIYIYIFTSIKISDPPLIKAFPGHVLPVLDDAFWQLPFKAWLCDDVFFSMVHFPILNYENYGFSRMRSKGSGFTLRVWGLRLFARRCSAVPNRSQVSVWGPYGRAYGEFCKSGHFWRFPASRCFVSHGRRGTSWHSVYTPHSTLYTLHLSLYTPHFTLYTPRSTLYTPHSTLYTPHSTLYSLHFILYTLHSTLHTLHFTLYTSHSTLHTPHFTLHTLHSTLHTLHSILFRIPQSTVHWYGNRGEMYKTVQITCFTKVFYVTAFGFVGCILFSIGLTWFKPCIYFF